MVLKPMAADAYEPTFSMGDDSPLPPLAGRARPVAHYLRQRFAQVTNPPIDPLRERLVMSLRMLLGPRAPLLSERRRRRPPAQPRLVLRLSRRPSLDLLGPGRSTRSRPVALDASLRRRRRARRRCGPRSTTLADRAEELVAAGAGIVILDRRASRPPERAPVPEPARARRRPPAPHRPAPALGDEPRWSSPTTSATSTASPPCSATAPTPCAPGSPCRPWPPRPTRPTTSRRRQRRGPGPLPGRHRDRRAEDPVEDGHQHHRLLPRGPDSSRCSAWPPRSSTSASPARRRWSAASAGRRSARTSSRRHADAFPPDADDARRSSSPGFYRVRKGGEYHAHAKEVVQALNDLTLVQETPPVVRPAGRRQVRDMAAAHLLQRAIAAESYDALRDASPGWSTSGRRPSCTTCSSWSPRGRARPARRGRAGARDRPSLLHRGHVARVAVEGGPREPGPGHEPHRRPVELRRGRRGPGPVPHPRPRAATTPTRASSRSPRAASA